MRKSGELQTREELMRPQATLTQYTGSVFRQVFTWMGSQVRGTSTGAQPGSVLPDMLIVAPLLQVHFPVGLSLLESFSNP